VRIRKISLLIGNKSFAMAGRKARRERFRVD
jgi:hypothetical protein